MVERLKRLPLWGTYALLIYMPFHVFLSIWLSTYTGGLDIWKAAKDVLTMALVLLCLALVFITKKYRKTPYLIFFGIGLTYALLHAVLYYANKETSFNVAALATTYNIRLAWYLIIGMSAALLWPAKLDYIKIAKIVVAVSGVVCLLALLQWVLPKDLLTHFGYTIERGVRPIFYINDNPAYPRVMATLRDPNSLGAFLIVPIVLLASALTSKIKKNKELLLAGLLTLHGIVLFLTFSRAAWAGTVLALLVFAVLKYKLHKTVLQKPQWWVPAVLILVAAFTGIVILRNTPVVRSVVFRINDTNQASEPESDQLHLEFVENTGKKVLSRPTGYGPGTAGVVSIQTGKSNLTENYYLQIAYEVGIFGLILFLAIWALVFWYLFKSPTTFAVALISAGAAYVLMCLVMHLWVNEAVAAQWWLLCGLVIGATYRARIGDSKKKRKKNG